MPIITIQVTREGTTPGVASVTQIGTDARKK